jgi:hypothetical protein
MQFKKATPSLTPRQQSAEIGIFMPLRQPDAPRPGAGRQGSKNTMSKSENRSRRRATRLFLDEALVGTRRERRGPVLLGLRKSPSQPSYGPVEVAQVQIGDAFDGIVVLPVLGGTVGGGPERRCSTVRKMARSTETRSAGLPPGLSGLCRSSRPARVVGRSGPGRSRRYEW